MELKAFRFVSILEFEFDILWILKAILEIPVNYQLWTFYL